MNNCFSPCKGFWNPGKFAYGIQNTAQGIRNPTKDWNLESKFH